MAKQELFTITDKNTRTVHAFFALQTRGSILQVEIIKPILEGLQQIYEAEGRLESFELTREPVTDEMILSANALKAHYFKKPIPLEALRKIDI